MIKVILTAIGCPGGPSIIQSLRSDPNIYIIGTDVRSEVMSQYLVDEFHTIPPGKSDNFIPAILDLIEQTKADVLLPLATFELLNLSKNLHLFEDVKCKVCVSECDSLLVANDRSLLYSKFEKHGFSPKFTVLKNGNEIEEKAQEFGFPDEKLVLKPFISHGSIGLRIIDDKINLFEQYRHHKPNNISIPMALAKEILKDRQFDDLLLSEYLPGKEFGVDMLVHPETHEIVNLVVRDNGTVFHSEISNGRIIQDEKLVEIAKIIAKELKLAYTINSDFKLDKNDNPKVLEINPRMPATSFLAYSAGLNLALTSIYMALGKEVKFDRIIEDRRIYSYRGFVVLDENGKVKDKAL